MEDYILCLKAISELNRSLEVTSIILARVAITKMIMLARVAITKMSTDNIWQSMKSQWTSERSLMANQTRYACACLYWFLDNFWYLTVPHKLSLRSFVHSFLYTCFWAQWGARADCVAEGYVECSFAVQGFSPVLDVCVFLSVSFVVLTWSQSIEGISISTVAFDP